MMINNYISKETIEENVLFGWKRNVLNLDKQFSRHGNEYLIYYISSFKPNTKFNENTSLEDLESLDTFVDKLMKDNDFITYVAKNKEEVLALFDAEQKLPFMFGILFVEGEYDSCGSITDRKNMSLFERTI